MQSFGAPRPTSNPYIHMLDAALARTPGVEHVRFDRRRALLGRIDVLQLHWPETLFGTATGAKRLARRAFAAALAARLALGRVAVVRTVHNVELPQDVSPWERRYLEWIERRTDYRIVLNDLTELPDGTPSSVIPHGHYRDWFADVEPVEPAPRTLGFVGLVRRYKGVESLIEAFSATAESAPDLRLRVAGNPSSPELAAEIRRRAEADPRIELDLRYLTEPDFARAVMGSSGIVLPYRFMHNSGTVLAALSLGRRVLVPRTEVNEALAAEVGPGWITFFDGDLTADDLLAFAEHVGVAPVAPPNLDARGWDDAGEAHREAFRRAVDARGARRSRRGSR
jgi:glycosyltransferase involved in cell wall biosynthesis